MRRQSGGGSLTLGVQSFIMDNCITIGQAGALSHTYIKNILKKVISTAESSGNEVLEDLYEFYAHHISFFKEDMWLKDGTNIQKSISFFISNGFDQGHSGSRNLVIPIHCSSNMLEGDTGCSIWPSSLFLSEFILSYPDIFYNKYCLEVGAGVGLVGIILSKVKASKFLELHIPQANYMIIYFAQVVVTDGDLSTLANMQANLELNHVGTNNETSQNGGTDSKSNKYKIHYNLFITVECKFLSWEAASESELTSYSPDVVLAADVIYDPLCLPHLVRVLASLLKPKKMHTFSSCGGRSNDGDGFASDHHQIGVCKVGSSQNNLEMHVICQPVAYIATVIRNVETFNYFIGLACQANLCIVDITEEKKPSNLLPYVTSYDRSSVKLYVVSYSRTEDL
ncbi:hypothetical protein Taro_004741 [Colocasia esculenta]|uniref:Uncharacterized protein n=1 Tax=Colocasia esculenta TaxID=4460 RepID=A0A843TL45_COLES|nr:hypothetical protein [Colocasia esculenta]